MRCLLSVGSYAACRLPAQGPSLELEPHLGFAQIRGFPPGLLLPLSSHKSNNRYRVGYVSTLGLAGRPRPP